MFMKDSDIELGQSKPTAIRRLKMVERRFVREPDTKDKYVEFLQEYEDIDYMHGQGIGSWQSCHVSSSSVPLKTRRVEERCKLNLSRAQASSHWCGVVVMRAGASSGVILVT
ncbi:hypothetical protein TNCV_1252351 [Trichonephila clavipes]|nr:hypothetical protein TNCV_1252351 [Trichonephila clavipes]